MIFEFISEGPKGQIHKLIKISETSLKGFYNLAFGDKKFGTYEIDDTVISNNGDSDLVLSTIVAAVYSFTDIEKDAWIYATGSTKARTQLYRMGINKYLDIVHNDFLLFGLINGEWKKFETNEDYTGFVVRRK